MTPMTVPSPVRPAPSHAPWPCPPGPRAALSPRKSGVCVVRSVAARSGCTPRTSSLAATPAAPASVSVAAKPVIAAMDER
jgi:hypothetical protein